MSETMPFPPVPAETVAPTKRTPTVYFIDDSATMREVIKIAFRRENITVITAGDAATAIAQFEQTPPDAVITDVIMPDQDGYSVCSQIKQHPQFSGTPVILMSGVVNKSVADKAVSVGADELIRKPFQPQELISRVKSFLGPKSAEPSVPATPAPRAVSSQSLSNFFAPPPAHVPTPVPVAHIARPEVAPQRTLADAFAQQPQAPFHAPPAQQPPLHVAPVSPAPAHNFNVATPNRAQASATDIQKLKTEISRLELLIKKLQTELQIERQYNQALEMHVKSLTALD
ncbi:MAG TPA: response regulator [Candidatus Acidoferrum sp.]|jgi:CheY-like chemotaxis protein